MENSFDHYQYALNLNLKGSVTDEIINPFTIKQPDKDFNNFQLNSVRFLHIL